MTKTSLHILITDDDDRLRTLLQQYLEKEGYSVTTAASAGEARAQLEKNSFALMVLDVMMPGESGLELTQDIRERIGIPILMLTAMGEVEDRIKGLESGADDYLIKPFEPRELLLRINKLLGRSDARKKRVRFGDYRYNLATQELLHNEKFIHLSSTEHSVLSLLAAALNTPVSREEIASALNGISERSVDVQITRLRKKIEPDPKNPYYLQTARGKGYVLLERE